MLLKQLEEIICTVLQFGSWEDVAAFIELLNYAQGTKLGMAATIGENKSSILQHLAFYGRIDVLKILFPIFAEKSNIKPKLTNHIYYQNKSGFSCFDFIQNHLKKKKTRALSNEPHQPP